MTQFSIQSPSDQVAAYLRQELGRGAWRNQMPGTPRLSRDLGVDPKTVLAAFNLLQKEGLVSKAEPGRRRRILKPHPTHAGRPIRIALLDYAPLDQTEGYMVEMQHILDTAGYTPFYTDKCLLELGMNVQRVARLVNQTEADAWIVCAGSREVLEWFIKKDIPTFALFGRRRDLSIAGAGPYKVEAYRTVVRRLVELGHRSLVLIAQRARRLPKPGASERAFLEEMAGQGLRVSPYNLPDWTENPEGLQELLDELFRVTPPTGLLIDESYLFHAVKHHLSIRGIESPRDVSLICTDPDRTFEWCRPTIAHIRWNSKPLLRYILRWAKNVARGRNDQKQNFIDAEFIGGGTIGPVTIKE